MLEEKKNTSEKCFQLGALTNRVGKLLGKELMEKLGKDQFDMPVHCIGILADLWEKDGVKQQDLAISIVKDKATIARALDLMEKRNVIVRVKDEKDKRNKKIYLTYKGSQLEQEVKEFGCAMMSELEEVIPKKEIEVCLKTLDKIYNHFINKLQTQL